MKSTLNRSLLIVVTALVLAGCGRNNPKDVAQTWLTAFYHMDPDPALKLSTNPTKNLINTLSKLSGDIPKDKQEELNKIVVTIKDVKETGDKAVVTFTTTGDPKEHILNLVRQGDKWLVEFSKTDLGEQMEGDAIEDEVEEAEPVAAPPADSSVQTTTPAE